MKSNVMKINRVLVCLVVIICVQMFVFAVQAQQVNESNQQVDSINYEVELNLLAANDAGDASRADKLPASFDAITRQLRSSLGISNFRVATTLLHRVREGGNMEVKGVAGALFQAPENSATPTFYEFTMAGVKAVNNQAIDITLFRFGLRVPIVMGQSQGKGDGGFPVINYEPTGITTRTSVRENTPTIIGTVTTTRANDLLVLVLTIKRAR